MAKQPLDARGDPKQAARVVFAAVLLVVLSFIAYAPSLRGGFLWDDPDYVVNNRALRSPAGLWAMWTNLHSLPQWYPMVHTTYWLEHRLFGMHPFFFRLNNLMLHIATAMLLWRLLWRLEVPGAFLAALIFALHPVHVESVVWITERKNTLSAFFYVTAFLAYWSYRSGEGPHKAGKNGERVSVEPQRQTINPSLYYWLALVLFVSALLSKTVTASFPLAVMVVIWWKTGRLVVRDVKPLVPFIAAGIVMGSVTAYLERTHVGAYGAEWDYAPGILGEFAARTLIASRALWFYVGKLLWPHPLSFLYERWSIDTTDWKQWIYPISAAALLLAVVLSRKRLGRSPVAALLLFGGTLFPALGYFNVFPHRYSFVADHFQYLASIALTTLLAAGSATAIARIRSAPAAMLIRVIVVGVMGAALCAMSFRRSPVYHSAEALWLDTLEKSPQSWVACINLGKVYHEKDDHAKAFTYDQRAVDLAPEIGDTWSNLATVYAVQGKWDQATDAFHRVREISLKNRKTTAQYLDATVALGRIAFLHRADPVTAEKYFLEALAVRPTYTPALVYSGVLYEELGRTEDAVQRYLAAISADPSDFDARYNLGNILMKRAKYREAAEHLAVAVGSQPGSAEAWSRFGWARLHLGDRTEATNAFRRALMIDPHLQEGREGLQKAGAKP